jgi:hypothetical protein
MPPPLAKRKDAASTPDLLPDLLPDLPRSCPALTNARVPCRAKD